MNDVCVTCRLSEDLEECCILDTSGGSLLTLCEHCRGRLERRSAIFHSSVCVFCTSQAKPRRSDGLHFFDEPFGDDVEFLHVCDNCRQNLINGSGRVVRA